MRLIDLSIAVTNAMSVFPGDPPVALAGHAELARDGFHDFIYHTGNHVGTHIDGPRHMLPDGALFSEIPLDHFMGPGVLIDARDQSVVSASLLDGVTLPEGGIVLVLTGWSKNFGHTKYFTDYPEISPQFAERLADANIKIVGLDSPSPDRAPWEIHKLLLPRDTFIMENLTNLEALIGVPKFTVMAFPLKLAADSSLARVVAQVP